MLVIHSYRRAAFMCGVNYYSFSLLQGILSVMALDIMEDYGITRTVIGVAFAMSAIVPALAATYPGAVFHRVGLRRGFALIFFLQWAPMVLLAFTRSPAVFLLMIFLSSLGDCMKVVAASEVLRSLRIENTSSIFGIASLTRSLGSLTAQLLCVRITRLLQCDWRTATLLFCGFVLLLGLLGLLLVRTIHFPRQEEEAAEETYSVLSLLKAMKPENRRRTVYLFFMYGGAAGLAILSSMWLPVLMSDRGYDALTASGITAFVTVGSVLAAMTASNLFRRFTDSEKTPPAFCGLVIAALLTALMINRLPLICLLVFINGAVGVLQIVQAQKLALDLAPSFARGQFMAMVNSVMNGFGVLALVGMGAMNGLAAQSGFLIFFMVLALAGSILFTVEMKSRQKPEA